MIWYDMQKMDIHLENPQLVTMSQPSSIWRTQPWNPQKKNNLLRPNIPDKIGQILFHGQDHLFFFSLLSGYIKQAVNIQCLVDVRNILVITTPTGGAAFDNYLEIYAIFEVIIINPKVIFKDIQREVLQGLGLRQVYYNSIYTCFPSYLASVQPSHHPCLPSSPRAQMFRAHTLRRLEKLHDLLFQICVLL